MLGEKVIIIGGSIAGLMAARVLSNHFKNVIVIEKDKILEETGFRPGVPQGKHSHFLHTSVAEKLNKFFPNFEKEILGKGAHKINYFQDFRFSKEGERKTFYSDDYTYLQSHILLEETIRSLVKKIPNVTILEETEVTNILTNYKERKINGIQILNLTNQKKENLYGDFIVDASGFNTRFPDWLNNLGYKNLQIDKFHYDLIYHTQIFRGSSGNIPPWKCYIFDKKGGDFLYIGLIESDREGIRWSVSVGGLLKNSLQTKTSEEFLESIKNLERPELFEFVQSLKPLSPPTPFVYRYAKKLHYSTMKQRPSRFIAIGDAIASFNPHLASGINIATISAEILDGLLANSKTTLDSLSELYFKKVKKVLDDAWLVYIDAEFTYEGLDKPSFPIRLLRKYVKRLLILGNQDTEMWKHMYYVIILKKSPFSLFKPSVVLKFLKSFFKT